MFLWTLFLVFNALLFSFVKLKLHTYRNSCIPSYLTKIKASSKNNTKLGLLSKKLKSVKQFTFSFQIFTTRWCIWLYIQVKNQHRISIYCKGSSIKYVRSKTPIFDPPILSTCTHRYFVTFSLQFHFSCYQELLNLTKLIAFVVMNHLLEILKQFLNRSYFYNSKFSHY